MKKINFVKIYYRDRLVKSKFNILNIIIISLLILGFFNVRRVYRKDYIGSKKDIQILENEIDRKKEIIYKLESQKGKNAEIEEKINLNRELSNILEVLPIDTYVKELIIDKDRISIRGESDKRESVLFYLKQLNNKGESFILTSLDHLDDLMMFDFFIEKALVEENGDYDEN